MIFNLLLSLLIPSFAYNCPDSIESQEIALQTLQRLEKWKHTTSIGDCDIEITTCDPGGTYNNSSPLGELLITGADGREAYVSIDLPPPSEPRISAKIKLNKRTFYYERKDRYPEIENGRTEVWRFEMRTEWEDTHTLEVMELGVYSTNNQLNQPNGNDSEWFVCKE